MAADICVIGPDSITQRASYDQPVVPAAGVDLVIVNGVMVWRGGRPAPSTFPGQFVTS